LDAVHAFLSLLKDMPLSTNRWSSAQTSLISTYRTNPIASRAIPGFVYDVDALGLKMDPRESRYQKLEAANMKDFANFYSEKIKSRPILFSIVGDSTKIDQSKLEKLGTLTRVEAKDLFRR
jgi:hypothetical protein